MMHVVDIEIIGLQPLQAVLDRLHDVRARMAGIVRPRPGRVEHLAGNRNLPPLAAQQVAQHGLRYAVVIRVGGVEEIHPGIQARADDAAGLGFVGAVAERHRAQAYFRNLQAGAAHPAIFHFYSPFAYTPGPGGSVTVTAMPWRKAASGLSMRIRNRYTGSAVPGANSTIGNTVSISPRQACPPSLAIDTFVRGGV